MLLTPIHAIADFQHLQVNASLEPFHQVIIEIHESQRFSGIQNEPSTVVSHQLLRFQPLTMVQLQKVIVNGHILKVKTARFTHLQAQSKLCWKSFQHIFPDVIESPMSPLDMQLFALSERQMPLGIRYHIHINWYVVEISAGEQGDEVVDEFSDDWGDRLEEGVDGVRATDAVILSLLSVLSAYQNLVFLSKWCKFRDSLGKTDQRMCTFCRISIRGNIVEFCRIVKHEYEMCMWKVDRRGLLGPKSLKAWNRPTSPMSLKNMKKFISARLSW